MSEVQARNATPAFSSTLSPTIVDRPADAPPLGPPLDISAVGHRTDMADAGTWG